MKVYTKTGDAGLTSLLSKERVYKDSARVQAYGTVDEANAAMGLAKSLIEKDWAKEIIHNIQAELIALNADLATAEAVNNADFRISPNHINSLEKLIDSLEERRIPQPYFVTPGSTAASAALDLARTITRRAERCVVALGRQERVSAPVPLYLNRLSDLLFVLARCVEQEELVANITKKVRGILEPVPGNDREKLSLPVLTKARQMIDAAGHKAREMGIAMVMAIVDANGTLVVQERMDNSLLASVSLALDKAYTAVALRMPTEQAASLVTPGQELYGINTTHHGRLVVFGGGLPIYDQGILYGGIGVSGGSVDQDILVAKAGLAVF
ncbi:cob(I)yrinic acid a,c-diamide adenosyltransferase [Sporomusa acidovorans]|uniref:Corrinoid adenosyltransferase n=1 Tax=Sporomusa acidovorans (strain ATCC 49682 / DSM 3132 / Mol) TaxID=1123286 RepID=A0ABZ3J912_SPOA4|nr:cob(I)yrinic acid a,c-diamide adenosyltransferase [Sporomusa acidovorans]OZC17334.1 Cob(I)yrinic acid a,c-diamide adenosyltransferase [Sporomusa acidovorans DSM 3132]SDF45400.1 Haem-degrading [Sporomusa acidovorans]